MRKWMKYIIIQMEGENKMKRSGILIRERNAELRDRILKSVLIFCKKENFMIEWIHIYSFLSVYVTIR